VNVKITCSANVISVMLAGNASTAFVDLVVNVLETGCAQRTDASVSMASSEMFVI
jgi:hypothetical protein